MTSPERERAPRVAVLGCGYWGRNLVRNFQALGHLATVCDTTSAGRGLAQSLAPGPDPARLGSVVSSPPRKSTQTTRAPRFDVEYRVRKKDGNWMWVHDRALGTFHGAAVSAQPSAPASPPAAQAGALACPA